MAKRFGRNQKRKLREDLESAKRVLDAAKESYHYLIAENQMLQLKLRRSIEIDVEVLRDNSRGHYEAMIAAHKLGYEGLHVAHRLEERQMSMQRDRDGFIKHVSDQMAAQLSRAIGARW